MDNIIGFFTGNPIIAVIAALVLIFFIYRKPKLFLFLLLLVVLLAGALYFIMNAASLGSSEKERLIRKHDKQLEDLR